MGEVWARPRPTGPSKAVQVGGDVADEDKNGDFQTRWRRVRSVWQRRDEVAQLGSRLGQAARRGASRTRSSVRWNKVGKDWTRVADADPDGEDGGDDEEAPEDRRRQQQEHEESDRQQRQEQPGGPGDKRNVWEECARRGQEWASRRSRDKAKASADKDKQDKGVEQRVERRGLLGGQRRARVLVSSSSPSAPPAPAPPPWPGRRASLDLAVARSGSSARPWSSRDTSRRTSLAESEDGDATPAPSTSTSLWADFRQGMASMLTRLEPPGQDNQPLLRGEEPWSAPRVVVQVVVQGVVQVAA